MLKSIENMRKWALPVLLAIAVFTICFSPIISRPPGGIHFVRQTDVLAFVAHYRLTDAPWYEPGILSLNTENGKAVCEWPMLYYLAAHLTADTQQAAVLIRLVMSLLLLAAVLRMHFVLRKCLIPYSDWILLLTFTSGVLWYYIVSLAPEIMALSFCLLGMSYVIESYHFKTFHRKTAAVVLVCFTLAAWLKITYSLFPLAIMGTLVLNIRSWHREKWFRLALFTGLAHLALVVVWYAYAKWYAHMVRDGYFLLKPRPLWDAPSHEWRDLLTWPWRVWGNIFLHWQTKSLILVALVYGFLYNRKGAKYVLTFLLLCAIGILAFLVLFAVHLKDHDYYLLLLLPFVLTIFIWGAGGLPRSGWRAWYVHISCAITLFMVGRYTLQKVEGRMENRYSEYTVMYDALTMDKEVLRSHLQPLASRPILIGDASYNGGLVALDMFGWTITIADWNRQQEFFVSKYREPTHVIFLKRDRHLIAFLPPGFEQVAMDTQVVEVWQRK